MLRAYLIIILCVVVIGTSLGASTLHSGRNVAMMKENNANDRRRHVAQTLTDLYLRHTETRDVSPTGCAPHCSHCGDPLICFENCDEGYEKTAEGQCVACSGQCKECDRGQGFDYEGNMCHQCPENCFICRGDPGNQFCTLCEPGYELVDNQCIGPCRQHCHDCVTDHSTCHICENGYGLFPWRGVQSCKPCPPNCEVCFKADMCDYCADGYGFVEEGLAVCQRCLTEDCRRCDDERTPNCWMYEDYEYD